MSKSWPVWPETVTAKSARSHRPAQLATGDTASPNRNRKDMDAYGADYSRDPWQIIRLGEEREKAQKAAILAKHGKGSKK